MNLLGHDAFSHISQLQLVTDPIIINYHLFNLFIALTFFESYASRNPTTGFVVVVVVVVVVVIVVVVVVVWFK